MLVQRSQVGGAGDVAAHSAGPIGDLQSGGVVGNGGAQDGNGAGGGGGSLEGRRSVGHDQVNLVGNESVNDGGAVVRIAGGILFNYLHLVAQGFLQGIGEALGGGVQSLVLHQLHHAYLIGLVAGVFVFVAGAAGHQGKGHYRGKDERDKLFHDFSPLRLILYGCVFYKKEAALSEPERPFLYLRKRTKTLF